MYALQAILLTIFHFYLFCRSMHTTFFPTIFIIPQLHFRFFPCIFQITEGRISSIFSLMVMLIICTGTPLLTDQIQQKEAKISSIMSLSPCTVQVPLFIIPGFSLHFPLELSYGYLRFEGNGKIPLGRQAKRSLKGRGYSKK